MSHIGIGSRIVVGGLNLLGLCEDFHIPGCCSVRGRGNMGIIWWCKPQRRREGENIEIWSKVWKFCTLHPHIISSMELFSEIFAKMVQILPSGRATWATAPPRMLNTRKILVSILILMILVLVSFLIEPSDMVTNLGSMETLEGQMDLNSNLTSSLCHAQLEERRLDWCCHHQVNHKWWTATIANFLPVPSSRILHSRLAPKLWVHQTCEVSLQKLLIGWHMLMVPLVASKSKIADNPLNSPPLLLVLAA